MFPASIRIKGFFGRTAVYGIGEASGRLLSLLSLPIFTSHLQPAEFGVVAILVLGGLGLHAVFELGTGAATGIVYFAKEAHTHRATTIWTAVALLALSVALMLTLVLTTASRLSMLLFDEATYAPLVRFYAITIALQMLAQPLMLRLQFESRASIFVFLRVFSTAVALGTALWLVAGLRWGVQGWVTGHLLGAAILLVTALVTVGREIKPTFRHHYARELLTYGTPLIPGAFLMFLILNSAAYFLQHLADLEAAGIFLVGYQLGMGMAVGTAAFGAAWYPFFQSFANNPEEGSILFPKLVVAYGLFFGLLTLMFFALARPAVAILAAPAFQDSYVVVGLVALSQFFVGLWTTLLPGLYFARETRLVPVVQTSAAIVTIALHMTLTSNFGIVGAAVSIAGGTFAMVLGQFVLNRIRDYPVRMYETGRVAATLGVIVFAAFLQRIIDVSTTIWSGIGPSSVLLLAYVFCGWHMLRADERAAVRAQFG